MKASTKNNEKAKTVLLACTFLCVVMAFNYIAWS